MDRTLHPTQSLKHHDGETVTDVPLEKVSGEVFELEDEVAMVVAAVRGGAPLTCTGTDGKWSVAMCVAAQRSVDSGGIVEMSQVL